MYVGFELIIEAFDRKEKYHRQSRRIVSGVHLKIEKGENKCNSTK